MPNTPVKTSSETITTPKSSSTTESFNWGKWFSGFTNGLSWMKDIKTLFVIVIIAFLGFTIWRAYFVKTQTQHNQTTNTITAQPGSIVNVEAPKQVMKGTKSKFSTGPFVGILGGGDKSGGVFAGWILLYNF